MTPGPQVGMAAARPFCGECMTLTFRPTSQDRTARASAAHLEGRQFSSPRNPNILFSPIHRFLSHGCLPLGVFSDRQRASCWVLPLTLGRDEREGLVVGVRGSNALSPVLHERTTADSDTKAHQIRPEGVQRKDRPAQFPDEESNS